MSELNGALRRRLRLCLHCGQSLPEIRLGVKLPLLKARIFDLIQRAGEDGILMDDLHSVILLSDHDSRYNWRGAQLKRDTLKAHLHQINEAISGSGYRLYTRARTVFLINGPPPRKRWWRNMAGNEKT